jgi:hypothetical protein
MSEFDNAMTDLQNQAASLQSSYSEERDIVNQLLGQAQMADSIAKFTSTVAVSKMAFVKENKLYRALAGMKDLDGHGLTGSWEEFCKLLGTSAGKVNEDINNLQNFGEEALESMSRMGIGYREMRQFRKLPADQKEALISVAKEGDKESFLELAEDIFVKHSKEKEELTKQLNNTQADYEAQSEVLNKKSMELTETRLELEKTRRRIQAMPVTESVKELRAEVSEATYEAEVPLMGKLRAGFELLTRSSEETGIDHRAFMAVQLKQIELQIIGLREEFGLPDDVDGDELAWLDDTAGEEQFDFVDDEFVPTAKEA